jgi:hypothetical protein
MDIEDISPKYMMDLIPQLSKRLWELFETAKYQNVRRYIEKWHTSYEVYNNWDDSENFHIFFKDEKQREIDLDETLHKMDKTLVIKIAIDLDIDTPGFLPIVTQFKNVLKDNNQSAYQNFERATKNVYENPDEAVSLASSTLEGIIKTILAHESFKDNKDVTGKTLGKLVSSIIKVFGFDDQTNCPPELKTIASQLRGIGNTIEDLRSDKSTAHGKAHDEYVVDDPLWASFVVNTSASLGMFLWEYFERKYKPEHSKQAEVEPEIDLSEIPF